MHRLSRIGAHARPFADPEEVVMDTVRPMLLNRFYLELSPDGEGDGVSGAH